MVIRTLRTLEHAEEGNEAVPDAPRGHLRAGLLGALRITKITHIEPPPPTDLEQMLHPPRSPSSP